MKALTDGQITAFLQREPKWRFIDGELSREWKFKDFAEAMVFVEHVAKAAEAAQHHPDIDIRYNRVRLGLVTHDAGGVTQKDVDMAERLSSNFFDGNL
jgi:4a-hydroxytetrahydrobiopterin dehydratase